MAATVDFAKYARGGECVELCPVKAVTLKDGKVVVGEEACIGRAHMLKRSQQALAVAAS